MSLPFVGIRLTPVHENFVDEPAGFNGAIQRPAGRHFDQHVFNVRERSILESLLKIFNAVSDSRLLEIADD